MFGSFALIFYLERGELAMQFRHGDVMIARVKSLPAEKRKSKGLILAHGEITGHCHQIKEKKNAVLYETPTDLFLEVVADEATIVHEEHAPITISKGCYRVWRQREYSPEEIRVIRD